MEATQISVSVKGEQVKLPALMINQRAVLVSGKWYKSAIIHDEEWLQGETVERPEEFIAALKQSRPRPDLFSFALAEARNEPRHPYYFEWDNVAVVPIQTYDAWWSGLSQDSRRNVRLAGKRGVTVRAVDFNDDLVKGIKGIYDETPIRQGRRFWHFGKDAETVKRDNATYLERSQFVGAYLGDELIGFIKMVYVGKTARIMQILSKNAHFDKKPANAMIAKCVEIAAGKSMSYLAYCRYIYGNKRNSSITEFKRRNGFQELRFPRYYVPLTLKGRLVLRLHLHKSIREMLPESVTERLLAWRAKFYEKAEGGKQPATPPPSTGCHQPSAAAE